MRFNQKRLRYGRASIAGGLYDIAPDGQRFLMVRTIEQQEAPAQINVVLNWYDELKRLAPVGVGK